MSRPTLRTAGRIAAALADWEHGRPAPTLTPEVVRAWAGALDAYPAAGNVRLCRAAAQALRGMAANVPWPLVFIPYDVWDYLAQAQVVPKHADAAARCGHLNSPQRREWAAALAAGLRLYLSQNHPAAPESQRSAE